MLDSHGRALAGAAVSMVDVDWFDAQVVTQPQTRTDPSGRFSIAASTSHLPQVLVVVAEGHVPVEVDTGVSKSGALSMTQSARYDLGDLVLVPSVTVRGKVRSESGQPLPNAEVCLGEIDSQRALAAEARSSRRISRVRTDAKGAFAALMARGSGTAILVRARGHYRQIRNFVTSDEPLLFELKPSREVRGRFLNADGTPATGYVTLNAFDNRLAVAPVAADGSFSLTVEAPGIREVLGAQHRALGTAVSTVIPEQGDTIELRLPETSRAFTLTVIDALSREPVVGAKVRITWAPEALARIMRPSPNSDQTSVATDAAGRATLPRPQSQDGMLGFAEIRADGYAPVVQCEVQLTPGGETKPIELQRGVVVTGTVKDSQSKAVPGARVSLYVNGDSHMILETNPLVETTADNEGHFTLPPVTPGAIRVVATAPGMAKRSMDRTLKAGAAPAALSFSLLPTFPLRGKLIGAPIGAGWRVMAVSAEDKVLQTLGSVAQLDLTNAHEVAADGSFTIPELQGRHSIALTIPSPDYLGGGLWVDAGAVRVNEATECELDIGKRVPSQIHGRVPLASAALPHPRLIVELLRAEFLLNKVAQQTVAKDGSFALPAVAGTYLVRLVDPASTLVLTERTIKHDTAQTAVDLDQPLVELRLQVTGDPNQLRHMYLAVRTTLDNVRPARLMDTQTTTSGPRIGLQDGTTNFVLQVPAKPFTASLHTTPWGADLGAEAEAEIDPKADRVNTLELKMNR